VRSRLPRLTAIFAVAALFLGPVAVAAPANAVDAGNGTLSVTLVDDLGRPVPGSVMLIPSDGSGAITLGVPAGGGSPLVSSSFTEEVEAGTYGAMVLGGWAGLTCVGLATCDLFSAIGGSPSALGAGAFTVNDGGATPLTITVATPKLTGAPGIGRPLTVSVPSTLGVLATTVGALVAGGGGFGVGVSADPIVTWNRNGAPLGSTGPAYTPTTADAGSVISATIVYPPILSLYFGVMASGVVPAAFTTAAVKIGKITPTVKLSVPGKITQGQRPKAYVNVKAGRATAAGVVRFAVDKLRPQQGVLRSGLVTFTLPKLKPGKHKVTALFAAAGGYNAAKVTKTVVVKAKKTKKK
jgi:hypothetical protein